MSSSKIIQLFHLVNHRAQCQKYIFIFIFISILLTLHLFFYFYFLKSYINSSPLPHTSFEESIFVPIVVYVLISIIGLFIPGDIIYAWRKNKYNVNLLNKTVEKGTRPKIDISDEELVPRPLVVERLKKIFQPNRNQSFYHVVCGEHGTGKTTLTRIASREVGQDKDKGIQGGMGVIYVEIPSDPEDKDVEHFGKAFGKSLNFRFEEHISFTAQLMKKILGDNGEVDKRPKWRRALEAFKNAGAVYKTKHDKLPVIVYDNISGLINTNPKVLDTLQDDAKMSADHREYIAIFVSSEGSVPRRMESRSAWSRAKHPVIEIGDLSNEESMKYLTEKRKINEVEAKKLYELVGGRIVELKTVADDFLSGQSFEVIKQSILAEVEKKFNTAQLLRKQLHHEVGKEAINALLDSKELGFTTFMEFFDNYEEADKVLETNIFSYHPEKNIVTFQSQSVESYIREKADIFIN